jgi:hypothetical protein
VLRLGCTRNSVKRSLFGPLALILVLAGCGGSAASGASLAPKLVADSKRQWCQPGREHPPCLHYLMDNDDCPSITTEVVGVQRVPSAGTVTVTY